MNWSTCVRGGKLTRKGDGDKGGVGDGGKVPLWKLLEGRGKHDFDL